MTAAVITPPNLAQALSVLAADLLVVWPAAGPGPLSGVTYSVVSAQIITSVKALSIFGSGAGAAITSGASNVALGPSSLQAETTGSNNVAIGNGALIVQNGGSANVAIGQGAGALVGSGVANIMIGQNAGGNTTSGGQNVYVGQGAGGLQAGNVGGNTWIGGFGGGHGLSLNLSGSITLATGDGYVRAQEIQGGGWIAGNQNLTNTGPTGGPKGAGTWNVSGGYYLNGAPAGTLMQVGKLTGANMNSTADQAIALAGPALFLVDSIVITNASVSLTTAQGAFYAAAGKTTPLFNANATSPFTWLTTAGRAATVGAGASDAATAHANNQITIANSGTIYLSLTTAQGVAATADIYVFGRKLT